MMANRNEYALSLVFGNSVCLGIRGGKEFEGGGVYIQASLALDNHRIKPTHLHITHEISQLLRLLKTSRKHGIEKRR